MAIAVSQVYTMCQRYFPDLPQTIFLDLLNEVDNELQPLTPLYQESQVSLNLVASQQEYTLTDSILRVNEVGYWAASGSYNRLVPTTKDELDYEFTGWRGVLPGTPTRWYIYGGFIGFYPAPQIATTSGYPIVTIFCLQQPAAYLIGSSLPGTPHVADAWTYGVLTKWCLMYHKDQVQMFMGLWQAAREKLKVYVAGRNLRRKQGSHPKSTRPLVL